MIIPIMLNFPKTIEMDSRKIKTEKQITMINHYLQLKIFVFMDTLQYYIT